MGWKLEVLLTPLRVRHDLSRRHRIDMCSGASLRFWGATGLGLTDLCLVPSSLWSADGLQASSGVFKHPQESSWLHDLQLWSPSSHHSAHSALCPLSLVRLCPQSHGWVFWPSASVNSSTPKAYLFSICCVNIPTFLESSEEPGMHSWDFFSKE